MKNKFCILVFSLFLAGCAYDPQPGGKVNVRVEFAPLETKLCLDEGSYMFESGDELGVVSSAAASTIRLTNDGTLFASESGVDVETGEHNFTVFYPYRSDASVRDGAVCTSSGGGFGILSSDQGDGQDWVENSVFAADIPATVDARSETLLLRGKLTNIFATVNFCFKHTGPEDISISEIRVNSSSGRILNGEYVISGAKAVMLSGASSASLGGLSLSAGAASLYGPLSGCLLLPPGNYDEDLEVTVRAGGNTYRRQLSGKEIDLLPGVVSTFMMNLDEFEGMSASAPGIYSVADWNDFVADVKAGDYSAWKAEDGIVHLRNSISSTCLSCLSWPGDGYKFDGIFDGGGFTITQTLATRPLFGIVTGTVRNLNTAGRLSNGADPGGTGIASIAAAVDGGGTVENCTNDMIIARSGSTAAAMAGIVRELRSGSILNCTNNGDLGTLTITFTASYNVYMGGIVAVVNPSGPCLVSSCTNKKAVTFKPSYTTGGYGSVYCGIGGIVGILYGGEGSNILTVENCTNEGDINIIPSSITSVPTKLFCVGGILGMGARYDDVDTPKGNKMVAPKLSHYKAVISNCTNKGTITNNGVSHGKTSSNPCVSVYTGGIAGSLFGIDDSEDGRSLISGCSSLGNIASCSLYYNRTGLANVSGGIVGAGGHIVVSGCNVGTIASSVSIGSKERQSRAVGGVLGVALSTFTIENCNVNVALKHIGPRTYAEDLHCLAVPVTVGSNAYTAEFVDFSGSKITSCMFRGSVECSTSNPSYNQSEADYASLAFATTDMNSSNYTNYIINQKYTGSDITVSGCGFWN